MGEKSRAAWVFALAAAAGLAGQTLLFVESHCSRLAAALRDDFRVVLFLAAPARSEGGRLKILEEKIRSQPEVIEVRFISADEAYAALKRDDPELAESVALVGDNPLPAAFEVRPSAEALTHLGAWLDGARRLADWSDIRYKSGQLQSLLRLRFYAYLLRVTLSALLCLISGLGLALLYTAARAPAAAQTRSLAAWAGLGGVCGMVLAVLIAWPLRRDELLWAWPTLPAQAALLTLCVSLGWSLSLWRAES